MILTPIAPESLAQTLMLYRAALPLQGIQAAVFERIAASRAALADDTAARRSHWHRDAVALAQLFDMHPIAEPPQRAFSWDGRAVRTESEPAVLLHEVAHYQLASPERRHLPDFGLGAGPETGRVAEADAARRIGDTAREMEEQMASLLGILWEVELGQPGILAFQEQNWLEGAGRSGAADFFGATLRRLAEAGAIDAAGRPVPTLRCAPDPPDA
jgi:hypothetical protein